MRKLTPKQKEFAERVARGEDPLAVTKALYWDKGLTPEGFKKWAQSVIDKPQVRQHVVKTYDEMAKVGLTVKSAALKTFTIMHRRKGRDRDKLAAAEMVFKYHDKANSDPSAGINPLTILIQNRIDRGLAVPDNIRAAVSIPQGQREAENDDSVVPDEPG